MWFLMENVQNSYARCENLLTAISHCSETNNKNSQEISENLEQIRQILWQGVDVNQRHGNLLPLHCACIAGNSSVIKLLLDNGK
jgi:ankyrin repeat protein